MRLNSRTDVTGEPGLFIEEIQSDRHQEGRKKGYQEDHDPKAIEDARSEKDQLSGELQERAQEIRSENGFPVNLSALIAMGQETKVRYDTIRDADTRYVSLRDNLEAARQRLALLETNSGVPDAPYRSTWPLQMFKRALRDAVASGKSWVGWTPGQVHTDRWGTERIEWAKQKDGSWLVNAKSQHGGVAGGVDLEGEANARGLNKENSATVRTLEEFKAAIAPSLTEGQNVETLGPKLWKRAQAEDSGVSMPRKEGFEHSYDSNEYKLGMVDVFGKYVKQWGAKVERGVINRDAQPDDPFEQIPFNSTPDGVPIWKVQITPQMRESVSSEGQALFGAVPRSVEDLEREMQNIPGMKTVSVYARKNGDIKLQMIAVDKDKQKAGIGTKALEMLTNFADTEGRRVVLTTGVKDPNFGTTSMSRLKNFYKRFGFVENKGRNKDFSISENMLREPRAKAVGGAVPDHRRSAARVVGTVEHMGNEGVRWLFRAALDSPLTLPYSKLMNYISGSDLGREGLRAMKRTREKIGRQVAPFQMLTVEQQAWFLESMQAKAFNGGKMREVVKTLTDGGEVGSLGLVVSKELSSPANRAKMFRVMEGKGAIESLPPEAQLIMRKLRKMLDDYAREAVQLKIMSPETYRANRTPDANGRTYMPRYFFDHETKTPGANFFKWHVNKLKGLKAQTTSAFHIFEADLMGQPKLDADNNPILIAEPGRGTWRFPNIQERNQFYERFIREKAFEALKDPRIQDKYAEARDGLKKLKIEDVERIQLQDEQVRLAYRAEHYNAKQKWKTRDPMTEEELEKAGLIEDIAYSVPKALMGLKQDIETAKLFNKIAKAGFAVEFDKNAKTDGYIQIPDNYKFGELRGKWVQKHLGEQLLDYAYAMPENMWDAYDNLLRHWKLGKTVLNPPTHFRNVFGNIPFADLAGVNPLNPANWHYYRMALEVIADTAGTKNQLLGKAAGLIPGKGSTTVTRDELMAAAMIGTDFASSELQEALRDILPPLIRDTSEAGFFAAIGKAMNGSTGQAAVAGARGVKHGASWALDQTLYLYHLEDAVFKAASYIQQRDMGRTREEAIAHARKWFPFYDQIGTSPLLRGARRSVFPFLSFTHEALRIMSHATTEKPITMAKWVMAPGLLSYAAMAALGLDDDDQKDVLRDMRGQLRGFEGVPLASIILPFRVDSELTQWDLTSTLPWGSWIAKRYVDPTHTNTIQDITSWLVTQSPMLGAPASLRFNADPFTGRAIVKPGMDDPDAFFDEALKEQLKFTWDQMMPPMVGVRSNPLKNVVNPEPKGKLLQTPSRTQNALRQGLGISAQTAQPNLYRIAEDFRKEKGLPTTSEIDYGEPSPKVRARRAIYDAIVVGDQDRLNEAVQLYHESQGEQIRTATDISRLIDTRKPETLISTSKVVQAQFRQYLKAGHPEAWDSYKKAIGEFSKVRKKAPRMLMEANRNLLVTQ